MLFPGSWVPVDSRSVRLAVVIFLGEGEKE